MAFKGLSSPKAGQRKIAVLAAQMAALSHDRLNLWAAQPATALTYNRLNWRPP